ncbi:hypothetical protein GCM10022221_30750 [Actinocorallia aurea]
MPIGTADRTEGQGTGGAALHVRAEPAGRLIGDGLVERVRGHLQVSSDALLPYGPQHLLGHDVLAGRIAHQQVMFPPLDVGNIT